MAKSAVSTRQGAVTRQAGTCACYVGESADPRSMRTRIALRDALAREIEETGDLTKVTVSALALRSGLTRRTFYSHFKDIPDLVGQIEDGVLVELRPVLSCLVSTNLAEVERAVKSYEPCPGAIEVLRFFRDRGSYLGPLLGDGGDPAFSEKLIRVVCDEVAGRAKEGLELEGLETLFDYYLTYTVSALVGTIVRWLQLGMREDEQVMARVLTMLVFVRPGDLYGKEIDIDVPAFGLALYARLIATPRTREGAATVPAGGHGGVDAASVARATEPASAATPASAAAHAASRAS